MDTSGSQHASSTVRVVNVYATPWRLYEKLDHDEGMPTDLSGLEQHYELYKEQLPRLLPTRVLGKHILGNDVALANEVAGVTVKNAKVELFSIPSKQVVLAVTICLTDSALTDEQDEQQAEPLAKVLDQCIAGKIKIGEQMMEDVLSANFANSPTFRRDTVSRRDTFSHPLLIDRHQLVFIARTTRGQPIPNQRFINKVLYRGTLRSEFIEPQLPTQLNSPAEESQTLGIVTPYVSLLYGHHDYVNTSIFLSTLQTIGTAARLRHIWREAYQGVLLFREQKQTVEVGASQTRADLEMLADSLGNLQFDLTLSVEFPLLGIETFRFALYDVLGLNNQAKTLNRIFDQLGRSLNSEITAIEIRERKRAEISKRRNWVNAVLLSILGALASYLFSLLPQVPAWAESHPSVAYPVIGFVVLAPILFVITVPYLREFARVMDRKALWWGMLIVLSGVATAIWALFSNRYQTGLLQVTGGIFAALGASFVLVGLVLIFQWASQHLWFTFRLHPRSWPMPRDPKDDEIRF
jgi:hypothetical protein